MSNAWKTSQTVAALKAVRCRNIVVKAEAIAAALRGEHPGQPGPISSAYADFDEMALTLRRVFKHPSDRSMVLITQRSQVQILVFARSRSRHGSISNREPTGRLDNRLQRSVA